jgi:hypothetical protein
MKQVIMFHTSMLCLQPTRTYSRSQFFTLLPRETVLVCIKVNRLRHDFCPQQPYRPTPGGTLCYLVKNTTCQLMKFRNTSLYKLLRYPGIKHVFLYLPNKKIIRLHKKWLRGYRVWYPLRKMFIMSQYLHKV